MKLISGMYTNHEVKQSRHKSSKKCFTIKKKVTKFDLHENYVHSNTNLGRQVIRNGVDSVCPALRIAALYSWICVSEGTIGSSEV